MKSIFFALATASVALVVNSAPSSLRNNGFDLIDVSENTNTVGILPISKRSISDKMENKDAQVQVRVRRFGHHGGHHNYGKKKRSISDKKENKGAEFQVRVRRFGHHGGHHNYGKK